MEANFRQGARVQRVRGDGKSTVPLEKAVVDPGIVNEPGLRVRSRPFVQISGKKAAKPPHGRNDPRAHEPVRLSLAFV
jgi:hypothetical protein